MRVFGHPHSFAHILIHTHPLSLPTPFLHKGVWRFFYQGNTKNLIGAEAWTKLLLQEDLCLPEVGMFVCMRVCMYTWMEGCMHFTNGPVRPPTHPSPRSLSHAHTQHIHTHLFTIPQVKEVRFETNYVRDWPDDWN